MATPHATTLPFVATVLPAFKVRRAEDGKFQVWIGGHRVARRGVIQRFASSNDAHFAGCIASGRLRRPEAERDGWSLV